MKLDFKLILLLFIISSTPDLSAQKKENPKEKRLANKEWRIANENYHAGKYADAEVYYKKSLSTIGENEKVKYNLANTLFREKRFKEAIAEYQSIAIKTNDKNLKSKVFHNIGNAQMELKDYQKASDNYKNSLRINPDDEDTRYNLALAQKFLKDNPNNQNKQNQQNNQNQQNQKDQQNQQNKENPQNQNNQQNQDNQQNKERKDQDNSENKNEKNNPKENKENNNQNQKEDNQNAKSEKQQGKMSEQQMKQLLDALNNEEKKTQEKVKGQKVKGNPIPKAKDW